MDRYKDFHHCTYAIIIGFLILVLFSTCKPDVEVKPNILWVLAEDLSQDLGSYGNTLVKTPNLDALAFSGMQFTNVFTTAPVCTPSRTSLACGMYQTAINAHHMRYPEGLKNPLPESVLPINELLHRNGYQTANIRDKPGTGKTDWSFSSEFAAYDYSKWDEIDHEKPFFAVINLRFTHRSFERDIENPIDPNKVSLPPYYPDHIVAKTDWANYLESVQLLDKQVGMVMDEIKERGWSENTIVYFFSDHGRPFTRAKTFLYDSGLKIPLIIKCPEGLNWIDYLPKGSVNNQLVSAIDISATTLSMGGIKKPESMQGRVILGPHKETAREYVYSTSDRIGEIFNKSRSVRSSRFRYTRNYNRDFSINSASTAYRKAMHPIYQLLEILAARDHLDLVQKNLIMPMREEELYDINSDPFEVRNLADNSDYKKELENMRIQLNTWQQQTTDYGMIEDSHELVQAFVDYGIQSSKKHKLKEEKLREEVLLQMETNSIGR